MEHVKTPHFTSAINWSLYLGLGLLKSVKPIDAPWAAIIDHSIGIGTSKVLVVLRVPLSQFSNTAQAVRLEDCECIGMEVVEKVTGETTAADLKKIFDTAGHPTIIIKDCDATLNKGVELWSKEQNAQVHVVEDIGHVVASALKAEYNDDPEFKKFISLLGEGSKRLRQTIVAFLLPPKVRSKGRFQSIGRLAKWAKKMLPAFSQRGRAKKGSTLDRLRKAFPDFIQLRGFIERFILEIEATSQLMKVLKNQGLTQDNYDECQQLLAQLPNDSKTKSRLLKWLDSHIAIHKQMKSCPLLVSSDIIESLFGKFKYILERGPNKGINRLVLLIPAMCGKLNEIQMAETRELIQHQDLENWEEKNLSCSLNKERRKFLSEDHASKVGG
jgi:hypothetical protein